MGIAILVFLKYVLLILSVILGILLLLLFLILVMPVRYSVEGYLEEKIFLVNSRISWLGPFFRMDFIYEDQINFKIRLLGIPLKASGRNKKESKKKETRRNVKTSEKLTDSQTLEASEADSRKVGEQNFVNISEAMEESSQNSAFVQDSFLQRDTEKKKKTLEEKIKFLKGRLLGFIKNIKRGKERLEHYFQLWKREETQITLQRANRKLLKVLNILLPSRWNVTGVVGFADPSLTGEFFGILGACYPYVGKHMEIVPDFEEEKIVLKAVAKGKVRLGTILYQILTLILNKCCFRFIKLLLKEREEKIKGEPGGMSNGGK